jgi:hypothetical protein
MIRVNATLLVAMMTWALLPNCNGLTGAHDDEDQTALLALLGAASTLLQVAGSYGDFNGTNGTTANGTISISQTEWRQDNAFITDRGAIVAYDNAQRVLYFQWTAASFATVGTFQWVRWTFGTDGKAYICPDLTGANRATLALSQQEFAGIFANPGSTADPARLGVSNSDGSACLSDCGCSNFFWNRLERQ